MKRSLTRTNKILATLIALLILAVGFQIYSMGRMHNQIEAVTRQIESLNPTVDLAATDQPADRPKPNGKANSRAKAWGDEPWINDPFFPESWTPFRELDAMQQRMNRLFNQAFERFSMSPLDIPMGETPEFSPNLDIKELDDRFVVTVDAPGADEATIEVAVEDDRLIIQGSREESRLEKDAEGTMIRQERRLGQFKRSITLPEPVQADKMTTEYAEGVLRITLPKT